MFINHLLCNTGIWRCESVSISLGDIVVVSIAVELPSVGGVTAVPGSRVESAVGAERVVVLAHHERYEEVDRLVFATARGVLLPVSIVGCAG